MIGHPFRIDSLSRILGVSPVHSYYMPGSYRSFSKEFDSMVVAGDPQVKIDAVDSLLCPEFRFLVHRQREEHPWCLKKSYSDFIENSAVNAYRIKYLKCNCINCSSSCSPSIFRRLSRVQRRIVHQSLRKATGHSIGINRWPQCLNVHLCSWALGAEDFAFHVSFWVWLGLTGFDWIWGEASSILTPMLSLLRVFSLYPVNRTGLDLIRYHYTGKRTNLGLLISADSQTPFATAFGKLLALNIVWPHNENNYQLIIIPRVVMLGLLLTGHSVSSCVYLICIFYTGHSEFGFSFWVWVKLSEFEWVWVDLTGYNWIWLKLSWSTVDPYSDPTLLSIFSLYPVDR